MIGCYLLKYSTVVTQNSAAAVIYIIIKPCLTMYHYQHVTCDKRQLLPARISLPFSLYHYTPILITTSSSYTR